MEKIKVFYLVYYLTSGGIEKYSIDLYKHINKEKFKIDFITKFEREEFYDVILQELGGRKIALSKECKKVSSINRIQDIKKVNSILSQGYDIAYFNLSEPTAVFKYPFICRMHGIKRIIIHSHNSNEENTGIIKNFLNCLARVYLNYIATERFACSDKAALWMYGKKIAHKKLYTHICNGIELKKYTYNPEIRDMIRKQLRLKKDILVVGHIGRLSEQKNHLFLLEIFKSILKVKADAILMLIGVGKLKEEIEEYGKKIGIHNHVLFLGERKDVNQLLQAMDVFLLPSFYEGLPIAGIEAQASGLSCVFSDTISKEADITGNVSFVSLEKSANYWAEVAINSARGKRKSQEKAIAAAGYNINLTAEIIQQKMEEMMNIG